VKSARRLTNSIGKGVWLEAQVLIVGRVLSVTVEAGGASPIHCCRVVTCKGHLSSPKPTRVPAAGVWLCVTGGRAVTVR